MIRYAIKYGIEKLLDGNEIKILFCHTLNYLPIFTVESIKPNLDLLGGGGRPRAFGLSR